jgi:type IV secretory pathway VirB4 component
MAGISIFCLPTLMTENLENFQRNRDAHNLHTRCKYNILIPNANLTKYQGEFYSVDEYLLSKEWLIHLYLV